MIKVPIGKELIINVNNRPVTEKKMIIEEDIAFSLSSSFEPFLGGGNTKLVDFIGSISRELTGKGFSGQFKQMGLHVWSGTQPLSLKITVGFYIDKERPDAYTQVYLPTIALAKLPLPDDGVTLIGPGPSPIAALTGNKKANSRIFSVQVGNILYLKNAIIKSAEPIFSNETDENNYPIWSKVSLDIISAMTATTSLLDDRAPEERPTNSREIR